MMPEMPVEKPSLEPGQSKKGLRDLIVGAVAVAGAALVTFGLENAGLIGYQLDIDPDTVVAVITAVGGLFGWRSIRKTS